MEVYMHACSHMPTLPLIHFCASTPQNTECINVQIYTCKNLDPSVHMRHLELRSFPLPEAYLEQYKHTAVLIKHQTSTVEKVRKKAWKLWKSVLSCFFAQMANLQRLSYLIIELAAPNTGTTSARPCWISSLNHKTLDISVKDCSIVVSFCT